MRVRVPKGSGLPRFVLSRTGQFLVASIVILTVACLAAFTFFYVKYARLIDDKLKSGPYANTSKLFAAPRIISMGDPYTPEDIAAELRRAGYSQSRDNRMGSYRLGTNRIDIFPGPDSYFEQEEGAVKFKGGRIEQIVSLRDNTERGQYQLEPQLLTNLFDRNREKRRPVKFRDIPKVLVDAITSAEDKRFFDHAGIDPLGIVRAAWVDLRHGTREQGASTLTQQLARGLLLDAGRRWTRKLPEALIAIELEQRLSKQEIFEDYCNLIFLGWHGGFRIHGFGEAAQAYFAKDIGQLNLPEAATLAGMLKGASLYNPYRNPKLVTDRRNTVLGMMRSNDQITDREYAAAVETPLVLARGANQSVEAPYFVDLVHDFLQANFQDFDFQANSFRVYTSIDVELQRAAMEAIRIGMPLVDELLKKQRRHRNKTFPDVQVALVAIDPHTGEVKAMAGGRNYGVSQLNHVLSKRQPGSIFKPFVYATALDSAVEGGPRILTAGTTVTDEPTTFWFDGKPYEPNNFEHKFYGSVTFRTALAKSLNVATVKVAEMVGYDNIVELANRAGLNYNIHPTPAVALGAYEVTPLEMAGAYTIFANEGVYVKPTFLSMVRAQDGKVIYTSKVEKHRALDPRVAYLMTNLMEEVMRTGTAAGVRARGFTAPAAGKTGTSHDGWFAGYTSELECIVWVGFDDNRQLDLEGAHSAAPIWAEFMKRALQIRQYRNARPFVAPEGIVAVQIDPLSGMPATPSCPQTKVEVYIAGTQPFGSCPLHGGRPGVTHVAGWELVPEPSPVDSRLSSPPAGGPPVLARHQPAAPAQQVAVEPPAEEKPKQKKGLFRRLLGVFK